MTKNYHRMLKLSCIGGLAGFIYYILAGLYSYIGNTLLIVDAIVGGIIFTVVGISIVYSLTLLDPLLKNKKILFIGGSISGFIAGLFFPWGIGMYVAIVILPVCLAITTKLAGLKGARLKIIIGGITGGMIGIVIATLLAIAILKFPSLHRELYDVISAIIMIMVLIYFMNLGILIGANKKWETESGLES